MSKHTPRSKKPKKQIKTIDATPSWSEILPTLLTLVKSKNKNCQFTGYLELTRMAEAADKFNAIVGRKQL